MDRDLDTDAYIKILRALYGFIKGWEVWSEGVPSGFLRDQIEARRRSPLLAADLRFFSASLPTELYSGPSFSPAQEHLVLGTLYVIEGSTLGGQHIARRVEHVLSLSPNEGNSYFCGYGDDTGLMWRQFQAMLVEIPEDRAESVILAAQTLFADFTEWNRLSTDAS
jgi:heme oxygenase